MKNNVSRVMFVSVITNIFLAISKVITGFIFKSGAIISDGIHSFSDLVTDIVAIIGGHLAQKPADDKHPYGHGKIEYLTSLFIGIVIIMVGIGVICQAIKGSIVIPSILAALISFITIVVKLLLSRYVTYQGKKMNNQILIASGQESKTDVISSVVVLISVLFMQLGRVHKIFEYSDKLASILVGIFILRIGYMVIKENISIVLGQQETDRHYVSQIRKIIKKTPNVIDIKSMVIMKFGPRSSMTLTILMDGNLPLIKTHETADLIEDNIRAYSEAIEYINIHIEPYQKYIDNS